MQPNLQLFLTHPMTESIQQISESLQHRITQKINQKGAISFAEFMRMALYEPGLGYYSAGLKKIGQGGDFITSPELGPLFATTLAAVFAPVLQGLKEGVILELGAGSGRFCCDVLKALDAKGALPEAYWILEVSADLKHTQQQQVAGLPEKLSQRVRWLDTPPDQSFSGIIFGNEVIDALPVEVFRYQNQGYQRLMLSNENGRLTEQWHSFGADLDEQIEAKRLSLPEGYRSEFIPNLQAWVASVTAQLESGLVMWVDYGYGAKAFYHPERHQGTLVCHQRHQANFNPYQSVGLQDITAFVDFTAVASALDALGFKIQGFSHQGDFLISAGLPELLNQAQDYAGYYQQVNEMKQLVLPTEMGDKFKVLAATKGGIDGVLGFDHNRLHDL